VIALAVLLLTAAPQAQPSASATPLATAAPEPAPVESAPAPAATQLPSALPSTLPSPVPSAQPSTSPTPSPYHYRFVPHRAAHASPGDPEIYAVYLNEKHLHSLGPIDIRVETTPEVVKVVNRNNGHDDVVPLVAPGVFVAFGRLPKLPFIAEGITVDLQFVATTADGRKTSVSVPVRLD
jgi:hypothetical protein